MPVFKGNTSSSAVSSAYLINASINNIILVNKSGSTATVNVKIGDGIANPNIAPKDMQLASGAAYFYDTPILLLATNQLNIDTDQSLDYYVVIGYP